MESKAKLIGHPIHPIHPMLIVFPLRLLPVAVLFDIVGLSTQVSHWHEMGFYLIAAGVLGGLLAAIIGVIDWGVIPADTRAKQIGLTHGVGKVVVLFGAGRPRDFSRHCEFDGGAAGIFSAWLGGELVDRLGVGVDRGAHLNAASSLSGSPADANTGPGKMPHPASRDIERQKAMSTPSIVVVGGINTDYMAQGPNLPSPGATVQGTHFLEGPGGKGANQAVAAARLGARVSLVARLGSDARGDVLLKHLQEENVDTRYVVRDREQPTGAALIQVNEHGEKQILAIPGANCRLTIDDVRAAKSNIEAARVVLAQLEVPLQCVLEAAAVARRAGAQFVLDPAPIVPLSDELFSLLTVIRPNAAEAEALTGIAVQDLDSAREAAGALLDRGVAAVAVQAGDEGNLLAWRAHETHEDETYECWLPRLPVESVDATGAGDAFAGALATMLAEHRPYEEAGPFANAAAALATTQRGAWPGLPRRDQILKLLT